MLRKEINKKAQLKPQKADKEWKIKIGRKYKGSR